MIHTDTNPIDAIRRAAVVASCVWALLFSAAAWCVADNSEPPIELPLPAETAVDAIKRPDEIFHSNDGNELMPDSAAVVEDSILSADVVAPIEVVSHDEAAAASTGDCTEEACDEDDEDKKEPLKFFQTMQQPYVAYRSQESGTTWIPGSGQDFGMVEGVTEPYLARGSNSGFTGATNITWLSGPLTTPISPRVYEVSTGYQMRQQWSPLFSYDLSTSIGIFSDFEGSAREGIRFPSHAVGMLHMNRSTDMIFGVDFLDRDDISVLPVFGFSIRSVHRPRLRIDLVFPRPRIDYTLSDSKRIYLAGKLGGETWGMGDRRNLVATYRDYRLVLGFENADDDGETSSIEFGYVFGRQMDVRGQSDRTEFPDAFMLRWVTRQ